MLNRVNEMLLEGQGLNDFATVLLIRMRESEGGWRVELASAGHPPAVHLDGSGAKQFGGGSVLGAWADAPPQSHEATIAPGETLVLCTDGWHEAGPVDRHRDSEALAELAGEHRDAELSELTAAPARGRAGARRRLTA